MKRNIKAMKVSSCIVLLLISLLYVTSSRHIGNPLTDDRYHPTRTREVVIANPKSFYRDRRATKGRGGGGVRMAGSSLPDCSHACGSCSPCRLVMVSFVCSSIQEAETCPMPYKCMCRNKSYHVP